MKRINLALFVIFLQIVFLSLYLLFAPINLPVKVESLSLEYNDAVNQLKSLDSNEGINEQCESIYMDQGEKSSKLIVFFHGFTNCPRQFVPLGENLFEQGYNVFIPRIPYHGYKDRLTDKQSSLSPINLVEFIADITAIAPNLGERVIFSGISGGGTMAAWAAINSDSIDKVVLMAPLLLAYDLEPWAHAPIVHLRHFLPEYYVWWDDELRETIPGPQYAYPRFSFKSALSFLTLSYDLKVRVDNGSFKNNSSLEIVHVYTENDIAVKNEYTDDVLEKWAEKSNIYLSNYGFDASNGFNHDFIDINQPTANPDFVYPQLIDLLQ
jgi:pimeloyl-ACP methyl ester carboxylesterase